MGFVIPSWYYTTLLFGLMVFLGPLLQSNGIKYSVVRFLFIRSYLDLSRFSPMMKNWSNFFCDETCHGGLVQNLIHSRGRHAETQDQSSSSILLLFFSVQIQDQSWARAKHTSSRKPCLFCLYLSQLTLASLEFEIFFGIFHPYLVKINLIWLSVNFHPIYSQKENTQILNLTLFLKRYMSLGKSIIQLWGLN